MNVPVARRPLLRVPSILGRGEALGMWLRTHTPGGWDRFPRSRTGALTIGTIHPGQRRVAGGRRVCPAHYWKRWATRPSTKTLATASPS